MDRHHHRHPPRRTLRLRENDFDADRHVLHIHASIAHDGPNLIEKDTKLHQHRRIGLDPDTTNLLTAYLNHRRHHAATHGITLVPNAFLFSSSRDGSTCIAPNTLSQRFRRLTTRLGIRTTLHKLRHYNATELILAGVNLRTVASRLGHADAAMTLNTYTAWINEADQRASTLLVNRLPLRLTVAPQPLPPTPPTSPYQAIANDLRTAIINGTYPPGTHLPNLHTLAAQYHVAPSTAHRAITQLTHDNLVHTTPGHPTTITNNPPTTLPPTPIP
nr:site-specific integrase [Kibdelosporangium phytohabitans]